MPNLTDPSVRITPTLSAFGWLIGLGLVATDLFVGADLGPLGAWFTAGGATLSIRGYVCKLAAREANAFELGQDAARIRSLR